MIPTLLERRHRLPRGHLDRRDRALHRVRVPIYLRWRAGDGFEHGRVEPRQPLQVDRPARVAWIVVDLHPVPDAGRADGDPLERRTSTGTSSTTRRSPSAARCSSSAAGIWSRRASGSGPGAREGTEEELERLEQGYETASAAPAARLRPSRRYEGAGASPAPSLVNFSRLKTRLIVTATITVPEEIGRGTHGGAPCAGSSSSGRPYRRPATSCRR